MKLFGFVGALVLALSAAPVSAQQSYPPRNECTSDPAAQAFLHTLTTATANRDAGMLRGIVSPHVQLDFGGGSGWALLAERLTDDDYRLWYELDRILLLGCATLDDGMIALPWYWGEDFGDVDAFETMLVTGTDVPLRASAAANAPIRAHVDWEAVTLTEGWTPEAEFMAVRRGNGQRGYIASADLRSLVDYRLLAEPGPDGYRITHLIAGD